MYDENSDEDSNGHPQSSNGSSKPESDASMTDPTVVMDPAVVEQWKRWTFAQIDNGRTGDDVTAEMIASGWAPEPAAALVDEMSRRAEAIWTRSALAQTPSAIYASRSRVPPPTGRFSIVGSVANLIIALYRMFFPDPEEELLPRKKSAGTLEKGKPEIKGKE